MAVQIGKSNIGDLRKRAERAMGSLRAMREKAEEATGHIIQSVTVSGTAFLFGVVNGRWVDAEGRRGVEIIGVPSELVAAIGMHVLGFMGSSKYSEAMHNIGDGALAAYTSFMGVSVGEKMRQNALRANNQAAPAQVPASTSGTRVYSGYTDAQLRAMAAARRR